MVHTTGRSVGAEQKRALPAKAATSHKFNTEDTAFLKIETLVFGSEEYMRKPVHETAGMRGGSSTSLYMTYII
jgi:hypothetical protein